MNEKHFDPIILPVIRKIMSAAIADELFRVQPMSSPHSKKEWPYQVDVLHFAKYKDVIPMKEWCGEMLKEDEWTATVQYFAFKTEEACTWFKLRWS